MYLSKQEKYTLYDDGYRAALLFPLDRELSENFYPARLPAKGEKDREIERERTNGTFEMPLKRRSECEKEETRARTRGWNKKILYSFAMTLSRVFSWFIRADTA